MNLAWRDVRRILPRFIGTALGIGLLFTIVLAMAGIYAGVVEDAVALSRAMKADLWIVQNGTHGPFADGSRIDPTLESRAAAIPHVLSARAYTYQMLEREHRGATLRFALVGLSIPDDLGDGLPLVAGRALRQAHGETIADESLGLGVGERLVLAKDEYRIVGTTRGALNFGGDGILFVSVADSQRIAVQLPEDAIVIERQRALERLRSTDVGRASPALEDLVVDPRWIRPAVATPPIAAVLVSVDSPAHLDDVRERIGRWPDVAVYDQAEEEAFLVYGVVQRARMQLGIFSVILTVTAALIVALILYTMTVEKTHDIAVLKLLGAPTSRLAGMVVAEAAALTLVAYGAALVIGDVAFPHFARRIVLTPEIHLAGPLLALGIAVVASIAGVRYALRVDVARVLEG